MAGAGKRREKSAEPGKKKQNDLKIILSCSRAEAFLAQLNLLYPELCCLTSLSLAEAREMDLCCLFGDWPQSKADFQSQGFVIKESKDLM